MSKSTPEDLRRVSGDMTAENIEKIAELFRGLPRRSHGLSLSLYSKKPHIRYVEGEWTAVVGF